VQTPALKALAGKALGCVIINLQKTPLDKVSTVRVWAKLDDAFKVLLTKLDLEFALELDPPEVPKGTIADDIFVVPYNGEGKKDASTFMIWDLRDDAALKIVEPNAVNFGKEGKVIEKNSAGHYRMSFKEKDNLTVPRLFGGWWINSAVTGALPQLPVINLNPKFVTVDQMLNFDPKSLLEMVAPLKKLIEVPDSIKIIQGHYQLDEKKHEFTIALEPRAVHFVEKVEWVLDESFPRRNSTVTDSPFSLKRHTDHTFTVHGKIFFKSDAAVSNKVLDVAHNLDFSSEGSQVAITVVHVPH